MEFKFDKNPLALDRNMYKKGVIDLKTGLTVLVGCNGAGKSTFLRMLETFCDKNDYPCITFDNHKEGSWIKDKFLRNNDFEMLAVTAFSSEGETIKINLGQVAGQIGQAIRSNTNNKTPIFIILDAIGSGFSIDNIIEVKEGLFKFIIEDNKDRELYIVVATNEYEFACGEQCLDIQNMKYREFKTYNSYKKFILKSKELKDKRDAPIERTKRKTSDRWQ